MNSICDILICTNQFNFCICISVQLHYKPIRKEIRFGRLPVRESSTPSGRRASEAALVLLEWGPARRK